MFPGLEVISNENSLCVFPFESMSEVLAENARCTFKIKYWNHHRVLGFGHWNLLVVSFRVRVHGTG